MNISIIPYILEDFKKTLFEPAHELMVRITYATSEGSGEPAITYATSEGSGEPAHPRSLARAFAVRTHEVWK